MAAKCGAATSAAPQVWCGDRWSATNNLLHVSRVDILHTIRGSSEQQAKTHVCALMSLTDFRYTTLYSLRPILSVVGASVTRHVLIVVLSYCTWAVHLPSIPAALFCHSVTPLAHRPTSSPVLTLQRRAVAVLCTGFIEVCWSFSSLVLRACIPTTDNMG